MKPIKKYIDWAKKQGYSDSQITRLLNEQGFSNYQIQPKYEHPILKRSAFWILIVLTIVLVISSIYFLPASICDSQECFVERSNACKKASYQINREGTTIQFTANKCIFTESIISFHPDELEDVKTLFQNKKMICSYTENNFPTALIQGLTTVNSCSGPLKDAINSVQELYSREKIIG